MWQTTPGIPDRGNYLPAEAYAGKYYRLSLLDYPFDAPKSLNRVCVNCGVHSCSKGGGLALFLFIL